METVLFAVFSGMLVFAAVVASIEVYRLAWTCYWYVVWKTHGIGTMCPDGKIRTFQPLWDLIHKRPYDYRERLRD